MNDIYTSVAPSSFSHQVLSTCPRNLAVLPAHRLGWTDLGEPKRVLSALQDFGARSRSSVERID